MLFECEHLYTSTECTYNHRYAWSRVRQQTLAGHLSAT